MNKEAVHEIRLGELKNAFAIITADWAAQVAKTLPGFFEAIKLSMDRRRIDIAMAMKVYARILEEQSDNILKENSK